MTDRFRRRFKSAATVATTLFSAAAVVTSSLAEVPVVSADASIIPQTGGDDDSAGARGRPRNGRLAAEVEGQFGSFAGYQPTTDVTNWALLDRDQRSLESQLKLETEESFLAAKDIYLHGGHSFSYAVLEIDPPLMKGIRYEEGKTVSGLTTAKGKNAKGALAEDYFVGEDKISVLYKVPKDFDGVLKREKTLCMVGGLKKSGDALTTGCYNETGTISIGGNPYNYEYNVDIDTHGHVTLMIISRLAMEEMYRTSDYCPGCPYPEFFHYYDYYQDATYGHRWVQAALDGMKSEYFGKGAADFTGMSLKGRADAVKKGTVLLNVFMYVLKSMRQAVSECGRPCQPMCDINDNGCVECSDHTVAASSWDTAVALYVGSLEGRVTDNSEKEAAEANWGEFLYDLAESRCKDFKTCGKNGDAPMGTSAVNWRIMHEFAAGQKRIAARKCKKAETHLVKIWEIMLIPLIQGTLKYAHLMDKKTNPQAEASITDERMKEKRNAEGATFAAAILPRINACNPDDADVLYKSMRIGTRDTDFKTVKRILEANYQCLGVTCQDIGGIYNSLLGTFEIDAEPCGLPADTSSTAAMSGGGYATETDKVVAGLIGGMIALLSVFLCIAGFCYYKKKATETNHNAPGSSENPAEFSYEGDDEDDHVGMTDVSII